MNETETPNSTPDESQANRPRRPDGTFMSKSEVEKLQTENKDAFAHLRENNMALMKGTAFDEAYFDGMSDLQVNKFLLNYHKKQGEQDAKTKSQSTSEPNTPILGTPVGSGRARHFIDQFLTMDPKNHIIEFDAPASVVLGGKHENQKEAINKWLDPR